MEREPDKFKKANKIYRDIAPYVGLGMQLGLTVTIMAFIGVWLDDKFDTKPVLTIVCSLFGVFAGMYNFIKSVTKAGKK